MNGEKDFFRLAASDNDEQKLAQHGQLRFALASSQVRTKQGHNDDSPFRLFEHVCHAVVAEGHHHLGAGLEVEIIQNETTS